MVIERHGEKSDELKVFQQWFGAHLQFANARQLTVAKERFRGGNMQPP